MKCEKEIEFLMSKIADINSLLNLADKGYEVGDVFKLEMEKEKLENKIKDIQNKNNINIKVKKEDKNFEVLGREEKEEIKEGWNLTAKQTFILLLIGILLVGVGIAIGTTDKSGLIDKLTKDNQKIKMCYNILLDYDDVENGCEEYFKEDNWYINWIKESKNILK